MTAVLVVLEALDEPAPTLAWAHAVAGTPGRLEGGVRFVPFCPAGHCGA